MNDYEKKYKEALNKAKDMLSNKEVKQEDIEYLFPELKESEDKIYKRAIRQMYSLLPNKPTYIGDVRVENIFAWLAKQGNKHLDETPRYNIGDVICDKSCTTLNKDAQPNMEIVDIKNGIYICDKGSFPVSQQDEYELVSKRIDTKLNDDSVSNELRAASFAHAKKEILNHTFPNNEEFELVYTFEEGAKWDAMQHIHAWSEEDENIKEWIMSDINKLHALNRKSFVIADKEITWLKSLKALNTWKPSDKQINAIRLARYFVTDNFGANPTLSDTLVELEKQLKKLK